MQTKSCMITIAGRPNVGKSTLTNALVGEKVAIVSNKPQTTRNRICGVVNRGDTQFVFVDTPGFHKPRNRLDDYMSGIVKESVCDVDAVLLLVEPVANIGAQEAALIASLKEIGRYAEEGPQPGPDGMTSDQPERQVIAELIREKLLWCLDKEVPHGTAVEITRFSERDDGIVDVDATIFCEKASHKGIIIGKNGAMLKKISTMARKDFEHFMGTKVYLQTWVKVKENWRDNLFQLRSFGYQ